MIQIPYRNGHVSHETRSLLLAAKVEELAQRTRRLGVENTELNRRLSHQNRPGKHLAGIIEVATMLLSEHLAGNLTGAMAVHSKYNMGRRRREWGVALLRLAGVVTGWNRHGLLFNDQLSANRAWQRLHATANDLAQAKDAIERLRRYLPTYRRGGN